jgi:hypothetical protein
MTPEMTCRCACGLLFGDVIGAVACARPERNVSKALQDAANGQNLAVVDLTAMDYGTFSELFASTIAGAWAGKVVIPESQHPLAMAVSPDGRWLAWDDRSARAFSI